MTDDGVPEQVLAGGNMSGDVVRVGATVRKPAAPQTATVHRVMAHARAQGVDWVPRVHGLDTQGRQVIEFIAGEVAHGEPEYLRQPHVLVEVARAAREWHDATASYPVSDADVWFWQPGEQPHEVIAHNDWAPYNHVFTAGHFVGAIDFDLCYPAPRLWDLAWTAYRYVPLTPPVHAQVPDGPDGDRSPLSLAQTWDRLEVLLDAYGPVARGDGAPTTYTVDELLTWVVPRLHAIAEWGAQQDSLEHQQWARMYRAHAEWIADGGLVPHDR